MGHGQPSLDEGSVHGCHGSVIRVTSKGTISSGSLLSLPTAGAGAPDASLASAPAPPRQSPEAKKLAEAALPASARSGGNGGGSQAPVVATSPAGEKKVDPLEPRVMLAGAALALCAGLTNGVAFRALGALVSHVTGSLSRAGLHAEAGALSDAGRSLLLVLSFAMGSIACGCLVARSSVTFGGAPYGLALMASSFLLFLALLLAEEGEAAPYLLAAACGMQNGAATSYSGAAIRTTHATGLFTDVGLILGRSGAALVRRQVQALGGPHATEDPTADCRKLLLLSLLACSFLIGVFLGAALHGSAGAGALALPACLAGTAGAAYTAYRVFRPRWLPVFGPRSSPVARLEPASKMEAGGAALSVAWGSELGEPASSAEGAESPESPGGGAGARVEPAGACPLAGGGAAAGDGGAAASPIETARAVPHLPVPSGLPWEVEDMSPGGPRTSPADARTSEAAPRVSTRSVELFAPPRFDTPRTPTESVPVDRLLAMVDALEPSLAGLAEEQARGTTVLQAEAMDAHRRLRTVLTELGA